MRFLVNTSPCAKSSFLADAEMLACNLQKNGHHVAESVSFVYDEVRRAKPISAYASRDIIVDKKRLEAHYLVLTFCRAACRLRLKRILDSSKYIFNSFLSDWKAFISWRAGRNAFLSTYALNFPVGYGRVGFFKGL